MAWEGLPPYPAALRPRTLAPDWFAHDRASGQAALRFRVRDGLVSFDDRVQGCMTQDVAAEVGDFVLQRRDGVYAYQLAVVVDDLAMGITEVVRGADLLDSTARQIQLIEALGQRPPTYSHLPLMVDPQGSKLSKRDGALTLASLQSSGIDPEAVTGWLAYRLRLQSEPVARTPRDFVEAFSWDRIPSAPIQVAPDLASKLRALTTM